MKVVAVICEYNPFHLGHLYHLSRIREDFGEDTAIVAVMSGNYVQRSEPAVFDKFLRAKAALLCGVNLVLELPFPFSAAGAGYFAEGAVSIVDSLGCINALSFGCESSLDELTAISQNASSPESEAALRTLLSDPTKKRLGYARLREQALSGPFEALHHPNNILAVEYLRALQKRHSKVLPHAVLRTCPHNENNPVGRFVSASYIRSLLYEKKTEEAFSFLPESCASVLADKLSLYDFSKAHFSDAVLTALRLTTPVSDIIELSEELRYRLSRAAFSAKNYEDLIKQTRTARYTASRVRRAVLFSVIGITSSDIAQPPHYTQLLACDRIGTDLLKKIKKQTDIEILTKPADTGKLGQLAQKQAEICTRADCLYPVFSGKSCAGDTYLRATPFCAR